MSVRLVIINFQGGGLKKNENLRKGLAREAKEEIGCKIKVIEEIGFIKEYRDKFKLLQKSYCYLARVEGKKGKPKFTTKEINKKFKIVWVGLERAIILISKNRIKDYEGKFIIKRDEVFLQKAKGLIKKSKICNLQSKIL